MIECRLVSGGASAVAPPAGGGFGPGWVTAQRSFQELLLSSNSTSSSRQVWQLLLSPLAVFIAPPHSIMGWGEGSMGICKWLKVHQ